MKDSVGLTLATLVIAVALMATTVQGTLGSPEPKEEQANKANQKVQDKYLDGKPDQGSTAIDKIFKKCGGPIIGGGDNPVICT